MKTEKEQFEKSFAGVCEHAIAFGSNVLVVTKDQAFELAEEYAEQFNPKWNTILDGLNGIPKDRIIICFDDGSFCKYDDNWPFAEATGWFLLPQLPSCPA